MSYVSLGMQADSAAMTTLNNQQQAVSARLDARLRGIRSGGVSTILQVLLLLTTLSGVSLVLCTVAAGAFG